MFNTRRMEKEVPCDTTTKENYIPPERNSSRQATFAASLAPQASPCASIASATLRKPVTLAPNT